MAPPTTKYKHRKAQSASKLTKGGSNKRRNDGTRDDAPPPERMNAEEYRQMKFRKNDEYSRRNPRGSRAFLLLSEKFRRGHLLSGDKWLTSEFIESVGKHFSPRIYGIHLKPGGTYLLGYHQNAATFGVPLLEVEEKLDVRIASAAVSDNRPFELWLPPLLRFHHMHSNFLHIHEREILLTSLSKYFPKSSF
jgi:hypothetical protein